MKLSLKSMLEEITTFNKPHKCKHCKNQATKAFMWADGRAFIPTCEDHKKKTENIIVVDNEDSVAEIKELL